HRFDTKEEAEKVFIAGQRKALGTTDEVGMSKTFFANPFGPVQEQEKTKPIIDKVFTELFNKGVYVGEIFTHLGNDKSKDALKESRSEEHTSELQSRFDLVCRLRLEKKKKIK